jgi:ketosteroid isomerase-like protein
MDSDANRQAAQDFLIASAAHDGPTVERLMADGATYWTCGRPELFDYAGTRTKEEFLPYAYSPSIFVGGAAVRFGAVTAEGDRVAIEAETSGTLPDGRHYSNQYHYLFRFDGDGRIVAIKEYMDTQAAALFFAKGST